MARTAPVMTSPLGQLDKAIWDYQAANYPEWYAKHSINNRRTVIEIYHAVQSLYHNFQLPQLVTYFRAMEKAGLIKLEER